MERSRRNIEEAELIFIVLDGSRSLDKQEEELLLELSQRQDAVKIAVINKADLSPIPKLDLNMVQSMTNEAVILSAKPGRG